MRWMVGTLVVAAALVGCTQPDTVALEHRSEMSVQARGVELTDDGTNSHVGMSGTTCEIGTQYGMLGEDFDYSDSNDDFVVDLQDVSGIGTIAVVLTPDNVNLTTPDSLPFQRSIEMVGVLQAGLTVEGGVVAVQVAPTGAVPDCGLTWMDADGDTVASVASLGVECTTASGFTSDPLTGTAWVSTDAGVVRVTPNGQITAIDSTANAELAWDGAANALYVGDMGTPDLAAFEFDGGERWRIELPGSLTALSAMGADARAAVSIEVADGTGEFVVVDGATGEIHADLATPSAASALDVSANGAVMAVTLQNAVHYFDVLAVD